MANRFRGSYRKTHAKTRDGGPRGVLREVKRHKVLEAGKRDMYTHPEMRRSFARQFGYNRNSDRIRNGLDFI
jgi:hypothetical protein